MKVDDGDKSDFDQVVRLNHQPGPAVYWKLSSYRSRENEIESLLRIGVQA